MTAPLETRGRVRLRREGGDVEVMGVTLRMWLKALYKQSYCLLVGC